MISATAAEPRTATELRLRWAGVQAHSCYGLDPVPLRVLVDRIGPIIAAVAVPVEPDELPRYTMSATIGAAKDSLGG